MYHFLQSYFYQINCVYTVRVFVCVYARARSRVHTWQSDSVVFVCVQCNFGVSTSRFAVIIVAFASLFYHHFTVGFSIAADAVFILKWHIHLQRTYTHFNVCSWSVYIFSLNWKLNRFSHAFIFLSTIPFTFTNISRFLVRVYHSIIIEIFFITIHFGCARVHRTK